MVVLFEHDELDAAPRLQNTAPPASTGQCHGTFGELMQGVLPDDRHILVTLPVNLKSVIEFSAAHGERVAATVSRKTKACRAVEDYLRIADLPPGGLLNFRSTFPVGKGLASSSADMVAAIRAAARYHGHTPAPETIESVLRHIEPTDGVMYDGVVSFFHREVKLDEQLGATPALAIVSADRGGECDTVEFNRRKRDMPDAVRHEYRDMLAGMKEALRATDLRTLGAIATRSCDLSQAFNPHPHIGLMRELRAETDALGLVATHSGTCIGLLYDAADHERVAKTAHVQAALHAQRIESSQYTTV
ncbi:GHMP kinase [Paraburkholderia sp. D15]|uniref:GHMP family kinase ATP-binding protein n=1 Tax=Paraburkholderia sp. D15 TaxID=2880218 RepID=UPI00247A4A4E|nr:GHMP kinase [Paraburkholderia sp. D15]WGS51661.1 GHMP kinase [Paraburkholderia sp. D15]WKF55867.1 L-threonine kinase [Paraburkholderia busanensis]